MRERGSTKQRLLGMVSAIAMLISQQSFASFEAEINVPGFPKDDRYSGSIPLSKLQLELPDFKVKTTGSEYSNRGQYLWPVANFDDKQLSCFREQLAVVRDALKDPQITAFLKHVQVNVLHLHMSELRKSPANQARGITIQDNPVIRISYSLTSSGCEVTNLREMRETVKEWIAREQTVEARKNEFAKLETNVLGELDELKQALQSLKSPANGNERASTNHVKSARSALQVQREPASDPANAAR